MTSARLLCVAFLVAMVPAAAHAQLSYTLTPIGVGSQYNQTSALGINSAGHVIGWGVVAATGEIHAFIWRSGVFQDLGLLGYGASAGIALDNADQAAVDGETPGDTALYWANGHAHSIGSIDGGFTYCFGINNLGHIVGTGLNGDSQYCGFSWINGVFTDLSTVGIYRARSINDNDQLVGSTIACCGGGVRVCYAHAGLYSGGVVTDLGNIGGSPCANTEPYGINNAGQVVGYSTAANGASHAFLWSSGVMQDLGTIGSDYSTAVAINNYGLIIGNLANAYTAPMGAFVYANGAMQDLSGLVVNGSGWSDLSVSGLNDGGSIVGTGSYSGSSYGFVAVPNLRSDVGAPRAGTNPANLVAEPNPFKPATEISFNLSSRTAGNARLEIFDPSGRRIATLLNGSLASGQHSITWNGRTDEGSRVQSGAYFARLSTPEGSSTQKLVLLK